VVENFTNIMKGRVIRYGMLSEHQIRRIRKETPTDRL
jgi:hypothetical protein